MRKFPSQAITASPTILESKTSIFKAREWIMKKERIKSKSFRIKRHHPFLLNPHNTKRTKRNFSREFFHFPFSFVFCLLYLLSRNVSLAFYHRFVIVTGFNFPPFSSHRLCFISFLPPSSSFWTVYTSHFIQQTFTQIYFNPQTRYTKVISLLPLLVVAVAIAMLRGI